MKAPRSLELDASSAAERKEAPPRGTATYVAPTFKQLNIQERTHGKGNNYPDELGLDTGPS